MFLCCEGFCMSEGVYGARVTRGLRGSQFQLNYSFFFIEEETVQSQSLSSAVDAAANEVLWFLFPDDCTRYVLLIFELRPKCRWTSSRTLRADHTLGSGLRASSMYNCLI
ncbi:hypothetical protein KC19_10G095100 [Ceratodon purpureus]|uniref:Uncharacterized protein n=1 Tax=Ceratodon purpureus TaxID=3225 RepID=A0A8T0GJW3_CERPU|nr:hypothetical protein KC19_10G095100 [Ceratodon purpureus]